MPNAIQHLLSESRKFSGKQRRYCLIRCTFWENQFFSLLGKKIDPVKPRWTTNFSFASPSLKVQFLGNRRGMQAFTTIPPANTSRGGFLMYALGVFVGTVGPFLIGAIILFLVLKTLKIKNAFSITISILFMITILMVVGGNWASGL